MLRWLLPLLAFAVTGSTGSGGPPRWLPDPAGDAGGAPDITHVAVSSDATGVTFAARTAAASAWAGAAAILDIDADANPATGDAGGTQGIELSYVLHSQHDELTLDRSGGLHVAHPAATWSLTGATLAIDVPYTELGSSTRIGFALSTPAPSGEDRAPDAGVWLISPRAVVASLSARFAPAAPRHGHAFAVRTVTARFSDATAGPATATCKAMLAGKRLAGRCRWQIPANARGRRLTVGLGAGGVRRSYTFSVR